MKKETQKSIFMQMYERTRTNESSFNTGLFNLFCKADIVNRQKLVKAFPEFFGNGVPEFGVEVLAIVSDVYKEFKDTQMPINPQDDTQSCTLCHIHKQGLRIVTLEDQSSTVPAPTSCIEIPLVSINHIHSQMMVVNRLVRALNVHSKGRIQSRSYPAKDVDKLLFHAESLIDILEYSLRNQSTKYNKM